MHFPTKKDANDLQPVFLHAAGAVREYGWPSHADGRRPYVIFFCRRRLFFLLPSELSSVGKVSFVPLV
jgi:hypothetical protein